MIMMKKSLQLPSGMVSKRTFKISRYRELTAEKNKSSAQRQSILIDSRKAQNIPEDSNKITALPILSKRQQADLGNYKFVSPPSVLGKVTACLTYNCSDKS